MTKGASVRRKALLLCIAFAATASLAAAGTPRFAWRIERVSSPRVLWAGHDIPVTVTVRNLGSETWSAATRDNLSYHILGPGGARLQWDGRRTAVPRPVPPGGTVEIHAVIAVPRHAGLATLQWDMVRENVTWFGAPVAGRSATATVALLWLPSKRQVGLLLATLLAILALYATEAPSRPVWWSLVATLPALWTWAMAAALTSGFAELAEKWLWRNAGPTAAAGAAILALPVLLVPVRARGWVAAGLVASLALVASADLLYMRWFGTLAPLSALAAAHQIPRLGASIRALVHPGDLWLPFAAVTALVMGIAWPRPRRVQAPRRAVRIPLATVFALAGFAAAWPALTMIRSALNDPERVAQLFSQEQRVREWGIVNLHAFDAARTVERLIHRPTLAPDRRREVLAAFDRLADAAPAEGPAFGMERGANLLLIQVESLQEWVIGAHVNGQAVTPTIDRLRREGGVLFFPNVFDETGQGRSSDGEFAALNSLLPLREGAVAFLHASDHFHALGSVLRDRGYHTISAHPFERGFWNRAVLHPRYGYSRSLFQRELGPGEMIGWGLADGVFFERMAPVIGTMARPFFAHLITLGLHHPFDSFPERHKVLDLSSLGDTPLVNYIHEMHYFDASLDGFLATLRKAGLLQDTVIAVYGDHESGLDPSRELREIAGTPAWDPSLWTRLRRIPLLILLPNATVRGDIPTVGGHIDIAPTLLYLLGVPRPHNFIGSALVPGRDAIAVMTDGSAADDRLVFVAQGDGVPDGGGCYRRADGGAVPRAQCDALARRATEELDLSEDVIQFDLIPELTEPVR